MMAKVAAFLDFLKLAKSLWEYVTAKIDEAKFKRELEKRRKLRDAYVSGSKEDKLKALRELQK